MSELQSFVTEVFEGFRSTRAVPPEAVPLVEGLQERLSRSTDIEQDVRAMYAVRGAQEFSIGMLWALSLRNRSGNGDALGGDVLQRLYSGLDRLFGVESTPTISPSSENPFLSPTESATQSDGQFSSSAEFVTPEMTSAPTPEPAPIPIVEGPPPAPQMSGPVSPESLGTVLEKFIESIQAGSDDRAQLLDEVQSHCAGLGAASGDDASLSRYLSAVSDFLAYIKTNDLLDDIRVMNIVTNFQEPFAQWLSTPEGSREGILEQGVEFLADFRAMFE